MFQAYCTLDLAQRHSKQRHEPYNDEWCETLGRPTESASESVTEFLSESISGFHQIPPSLFAVQIDIARKYRRALDRRIVARAPRPRDTLRRPRRATDHGPSCTPQRHGIPLSSAIGSEMIARDSGSCLIINLLHAQQISELIGCPSSLLAKHDAGAAMPGRASYESSGLYKYYTLFSLSTFAGIYLHP